MSKGDPTKNKDTVVSSLSPPDGELGTKGTTSKRHVRLIVQPKAVELGQELERISRQYMDEEEYRKKMIPNIGKSVNFKWEAILTNRWDQNMDEEEYRNKMIPNISRSVNFKYEARLTNRWNPKKTNGDKVSEQTENGKTQGKTVNRCPSRIEDILMAIQPITGRMRPDAEGGIIVKLNGDLEQMTIDIYTTERRDQVTEGQLMDRIKSEHEENRFNSEENIKSRIGTKMEQFSNIFYVLDAEPFKISVPIMGEIMTWLKKEIQTTRTQTEGGKNILRAEETEIQELVEFIRNQMVGTGTSEWWKYTQSTGGEPTTITLKAWYRRLAILMALEAIGNQQEPRPVEVRVQLEGSQLKAEVYQCYERTRVQGTKVMVNIHME